MYYFILKFAIKKMLGKIGTILIFSLLFLNTDAQQILNKQRCGTDEYHKLIAKQTLNYHQQRKSTNIQIKEWIKSIEKLDAFSNTITIPVVVHVVWKNNNQNISDAQIFSQIDVLNNDFRRKNMDTIMTPIVWKNIAADCEIEFCLATTDPNGNPTNGITRTQTSVNSFSMNDDVKHTDSGGKDAWSNDKYLNIWVCNLGSGLLGYATQPWGNNINDEDGVVIGYDCFGSTGTAQSPYNKGRTATHEVGHWLNLDHLWGYGNCGNDNCADTPKQDDANYSCGPFPLTSQSCNNTGPNGTMFMNYMDYTSDGCMNMFTEDQKNRMIAAIINKRPGLLNQNLCVIPNYIEYYQNNENKKLIRTIDILGRKITKKNKHNTIFNIYNDGSVEKILIIE